MKNSDTIPPRATLEVRKEQGVWADLRITNNGEKPILIHNPGDYLPYEQWEFSREAYTVAVLQSFHFLKMRLFTVHGALVDSNPIATLADHTVQLPLELKPKTGVRILSIPLHEFYNLTSASSYSLEVTYGDDALRVHAKCGFQYP